MSVHNLCGAQVKWAHRSNDPDKWHPPLDPIGLAYIIVDEQVVEVMTYKLHDCDPMQMATWKERKAKQAEIKGEPLDAVDVYELHREDIRLTQWQLALKAPCSRCGAERGTMCMSMAQKYRKTGEIVEIKWPHPGRVEDGQIINDAEE